MSRLTHVNSILVYHPDPIEAAKYASLIRGDRGIRVLIAGRRDQARAVISDVDIVYAWKFPTDLYQYAGRLRWLQAMGAGIEWALVDPLPRGAVLTRAPGIFGPWMSEYVLAWCLWVTQRIGRYLEAKSGRRWLDTVLPGRLRGKTILLIGVGDVGRAVAKSTRSLGARVIGVNTTGKPIREVDQMYRVDQLPAALRSADFVVLLVPLTPATRGMIGRRELGAMKRSAWLINIARGAVTDEVALVQALQQRKIAGAILDVFTTEPLPAEHAFWTLDNCIVTPHIAGPSTPEEIAPIFNDNLRRFIAKRPLRHRADVMKGY